MGQGSPGSSDARFTRLLLVIGAAGAVTIAGAIFAWQHDTFYVTEREPQTAITSYWMVRDGSGPLTSETPIFGAPWRIPFELPLFQYLAAQLSRVGIGLDHAGRIVSGLLFLLCLPVMARIADRVGLTDAQRNALLALAITSPIYVTYAFAFSIESTALLLSLLYVERWIAWERDRSPWSLLFSVLAGLLAAACKTTTWAVWAAVIGVVVVARVAAALRRKEIDARTVAGRILVLALPLSAGALWTLYAEAVRSANPIAAEGLSSSALAAWFFGTLTQKLSPTEWAFYLGRSLVTVLGFAAPVAVVLAGMKAASSRMAWKDHCPLLAVAAAGFLAGPVVFTNLHFVHDHYVFASGILLLFAVVTPFRERAPRWLLVILVASNLATLAGYLYLKQMNYDDPLNRHIASAVRDLPEECTIVVLGALFDAYVPYESGHKALQATPAGDDDPAYWQAVALTRAEGICGVVAKGDRFRPIAVATARRLGLEASYQLSNKVWLYYSEALEGHLNLSFLDATALARERIDEVLTTANRGDTRIVLALSTSGGPAVVMMRGGNVYLADLEHGVRIVHHRWTPGWHEEVQLELAP